MNCLLTYVHIICILLGESHCRKCWWSC